MRKKDLNEIKRLLIIVDMVNGFVREGALADPYIANIIGEQLRLIKMIQNEKEGLAFVKDAHNEECLEFKNYPPHCIKGTYESELIDEFKPYENDALVYEKNSTSALFAPNFMKDIKKMRMLREVIITGCCTDICVANLAIPLKNLFNEVGQSTDIIVPRNAVETYHLINGIVNHDRNEYNERAFKFMEQAGIETPKIYVKR